MMDVFSNIAPVLGFGFPQGMGEWLIIAAIGLLLFGKRLPEVGRSLGKGIVEFKKGLKGVEEDVERASDEKPKLEGGEKPKLPKFDPETGEPINREAGTEPKTT